MSAGLAATMLLAALPADSVRAQTGSAFVVGEVFDSLATRPLAGAVVQLVGLDSALSFAQSRVTGADGRYQFEFVPDGVFALGFFGSVLDSLGLGPPIRAVEVRGQTVVQADLGVPSVWTLRALLCADAGEQGGAGGLILGRVREAAGGAPSADATIAASWFELAVDEQGVSLGLRTRTTRSGANGWYALCDAPVAGEALLWAALGEDSTDRVSVTTDGARLLRRDLYLGAARTVRPAAGTARSASVPSLPATEEVVQDGSDAPMLRVGDGVLRGRVRTGLGGQPLPSAIVAIAGGAPAAADDQGYFTLRDVPMGTRLLEVRAIGYFPARLAVDVIDSAAPVQAELSSIKSVLDSVRIVAARNRSENLLGFDRRRETERLGLFLTREDVLRRPVNQTSEILATLRGIRVQRDTDGRSSLVMRQSLSRETCRPAIFIDTVEMSIGSLPLTFEDLDGFVRKGDIEAIEVYPPGHVPARFQTFGTVGFSGCGAIVLWSRP